MIWAHIAIFWDILQIKNVFPVAFKMYSDEEIYLHDATN